MANKKNASLIKEQLGPVSQKPMVEEKRWGTCRTLDHFKSGEETIVRKIELNAGKNTSYHQHALRKEVWIILAGGGQLILNEVIQEITSL
ncbi:MAG: hypothetical protein H7X86_01170 [Gorillibacterium sp.]|nr:hypothetical protein [Gorillibacterium sp.]